MMTARAGSADLVYRYLAGNLADISPSFQASTTPSPLATAHEQTGMDQIRAQYGLNGQGQTVAIIDSGIAYDHPALGGGLGRNYRVVGGWDFTEGSAWNGEPDPYDDGPKGSHGTHVAGIVGSNDSDNLGVAPAVDLVALRVFDDKGAGYFGWVEQALTWVYEHRNDFRNPITTVNLSLGASWNDDHPPDWAMLEDDLRRLDQVGVFISVAAGNDFQYYYQPGLSYPAASPYVVAAMSTDPGGDLSYFSQRLDRAIATPGQGIRSTVPDYAGNQNGQTDDYATYSGTSMAAPYLAGAAVVIRQALQQAGRVNVDRTMIYQVMRSTADKIYDSVTDAYYWRLNMKRAIDSVLGGDQEGNTRSTASKVDSFMLRKTLSADIDYSDDRDFFAFTAARSGKMTISIEGEDGMLFQIRRYFADGSSRYANGNAMSMTVKAGQTYSFSIRGLAAVGEYRLTFLLTPTFQQLGDIGQRTFKNERVSGEKWFQFAARCNGAVQIESTINRNSKDIRLELYDSNFRKLEAGAGRYKDIVSGNAECSETFFIRLVGKSSSVKLRIRSIAIDAEALPEASSSGATDPHGAGMERASAGNSNSPLVANSIEIDSLPGISSASPTVPLTAAAAYLNECNCDAVIEELAA